MNTKFILSVLVLGLGSLIGYSNAMEQHEVPVEAGINLLPLEMLEKILDYAKAGDTLDKTIANYENLLMVDKRFNTFMSNPKMLAKFMEKLHSMFPESSLLDIVLKIKKGAPAKALKLLIEEGKFDVNDQGLKRGGAGMHIRPLYEATMKNRIDIVKVLIDVGATKGLARAFADLYEKYGMLFRKELDAYLLDHDWTKDQLQKLPNRTPGFGGPILTTFGVQAVSGKKNEVLKSMFELLGRTIASEGLTGEVVRGRGA